MREYRVHFASRRLGVVTITVVGEDIGRGEALIGAMGAFLEQFPGRKAMPLAIEKRGKFLPISLTEDGKLDLSGEFAEFSGKGKR
jgi:uncharacterized membrane protein